MLHIVNANNRGRYKAQLEESYRIRHRVFVERRGWEDLRKADGREIDQFDNDDTIHLLFMDERRRVLGGSRLTPSTRPTLLSEVFPHLASFKDIPRAEHVYDWTRFYVTPATRGENASNTIAAQIQSGLIGYCLEEGIETLTAIIDPAWIIRFGRYGLNPEALGLPLIYKGEPMVAVTLTLSEEALEATRRLHAGTETVLAYT